MSEQEIRHANPKEGFDHTEPQSGSIAMFGIGSVVLLVLTIVALQVYFNKIWDEAVYEKILAPPSEQLIELHQREDWQLTHYQYVDQKSGAVRLPVERATRLFLEEQAAGKSFYPTKDVMPKKEEPAAAAAQAPAPAK
jgi:hypothetical protein